MDPNAHIIMRSQEHTGTRSAKLYLRASYLTIACITSALRKCGYSCICSSYTHVCTTHILHETGSWPHQALTSVEFIHLFASHNVAECKKHSEQTQQIMAGRNYCHLAVFGSFIYICAVSQKKGFYRNNTELLLRSLLHAI